MLQKQRNVFSVSVKEKGHVNKLYGSLARSTQYFHYNLSLAKPKKVRNRSGPSFSDCHRESNRHFRCWEFKFHYWQKLPATKHADWTRCAFSAYARGRENTETAGTDRSKCHFCCLLMLVLRALLTRPFSCKGSGYIKNESCQICADRTLLSKLSFWRVIGISFLNFNTKKSNSSFKRI